MSPEAEESDHAVRDANEKENAEVKAVVVRVVADLVERDEHGLAKRRRVLDVRRHDLDIRGLHDVARKRDVPDDARHGEVVLHLLERRRESRAHTHGEYRDDTDDVRALLGKDDRRKIPEPPRRALEQNGNREEVTVRCDRPKEDDQHAGKRQRTKHDPRDLGDVLADKVCQGARPRSRLTAINVQLVAKRKHSDDDSGRPEREAEEERALLHAHVEQRALAAVRLEGGRAVVGDPVWQRREIQPRPLGEARAECKRAHAVHGDKDGRHGRLPVLLPQRTLHEDSRLTQEPRRLAHKPTAGRRLVRCRRRGCGRLRLGRAVNRNCNHVNVRIPTLRGALACPPEGDGDRTAFPECRKLGGVERRAVARDLAHGNVEEPIGRVDGLRERKADRCEVSDGVGAGPVEDCPAAATENEEVVEHLEDFVARLVDDCDDRASAARNRLEMRAHFERRRRVEASRRLVQYNQRGVCHQLHADVHALLLAAADPAQHLVTDLCVAHVREIEHAEHTLNLSLDFFRGPRPHVLCVD
eukprot:Opistho-1_new@43412